MHNSSKTIVESIESILAQDYRNLEIIVVDDASTDNSVDIVNQFRESRVKLFTQKHSGVTKTRNNAISYSSGEFIAILDSDDIALPARTEMQVSTLVNSPGLGLIGSEAEFIDQHGKSEGFSNFHRPADLYAADLATKKTGFIHSSITYRKSAIEKAGGFNPLFKKAEDLDLILKISENNQISILQQPLVKYRRHPTSVSHATGKYGREIWYYGAIAAIDHFCRKSGHPPISEQHLKPFDKIYDSSSYKSHMSNRAKLATAKQNFSKKPNARNFWTIMKLFAQNPKVVLYSQNNIFRSFALETLKSLNLEDVAFQMSPGHHE